MSTVKITDLNELTQLNSNTDLTVVVGVDVQSDITGKITATTLAEGLYAHNVLNVGNNAVIFPDVIGQFVSEGTNYLQVNLQNTNGNASSDYVATADNGTDTTNFIDVGINGSTFNDSNYSSMKANDGYVVVQGNTGHAGGNIIIGTATTGTQIKFIAGGLTLDNIVGTITNTGAHFPNIDTEISANLATAKAYTDTANVYNQGLNSAQNARIDASFTKANNALANSSGTFAGDLTVTGNTRVQSLNTANFSVQGTANVSGTLNVVGVISGNAQVVLANTNFAATESALTISASPTVVTPAADGYMIHISGKNGVASKIVTDSYGAGAYSVYASRTARGTSDAPSAVQTGDIIGRFSGGGYGTTKFQTFGTSRIDFVATENYTDANTGSQIQFWNCPIGSNTLSNIATFNGQSAIFTGVVNPQKGFIFTPRVVSGNTTSLVVDFANDSTVKVSCNADMTISFTNHTAGKVVDVWVTNLHTSQHSVTHGCSSLNATNNATTKNIPATSSMLLKYFCIAGDLANTFVAITQG